jgi:hypothetical protein
MIQKNRLRLFLAGLGLFAVIGLVFFIPHFEVPGMLLSLGGAYLIFWATVGKGGWCRSCKKYNIG